MVTHLEPDILECEVKWALRSMNRSKASGGDGIPAELFQILKDDVKMLHSIYQQIWSWQWPKDWKSVRGRSISRDPVCHSLLLRAVSQGLSIPYQFLENRNEQSCAQFSGLRSWERAPAWIPFSDSLQWLPSVTCYLKVIYSVMPLLGYEMLSGPLKIVTCLALFLLIFFFFLLPKASLYEDI